jgi:hypothetical protein
VPENFEGFESLKESKVETLFGGLINKNGYKYMQCGNPGLITCIKNLGWFFIKKHGCQVHV